MLTHLHPLLDLPPPPLNLFPSFVFGVQPPLLLLPFSIHPSRRVSRKAIRLRSSSLPPPPPFQPTSVSRRQKNLHVTCNVNEQLKTAPLQTRETGSLKIVLPRPPLPCFERSPPSYSRSSLFNPPAKPKRHDDRCKFFFFFFFFCATLFNNWFNHRVARPFHPPPLDLRVSFRFSSRFFIGMVKKLSLERFAILVTVESARDFFFFFAANEVSGDKTVFYMWNWNKEK